MSLSAEAWAASPATPPFTKNLTRFAIPGADCPVRRASVGRCAWSPLGAAASGLSGVSIPVQYGGWSAQSARLEIEGRALPCHPLVRSVGTPPEGLIAEVVDLGRGSPTNLLRRA